jgi:hypothetical protein
MQSKANLSGIVGRDRLTWGENGERLSVHLGAVGDGPLVVIVPDARHRGMWRLQSCDGRLSDMANLARAKDAAISLALGILNRRQEGQETAREGSPVGPIEVGATPSLGAS